MELKRILVVDDEHGLRVTLAANLELEGFDVVDASTGPEALALLATGQFDLVISDMRMPVMNGLDLMRAIKRQRPALPVVLMTGFEHEQMIDQAIAEGVFTILTKPFQIGELLDVVKRATRGAVLLVDQEECGSGPARKVLEFAGVRSETVSSTHLLEEIGKGWADVCVINICASSADSQQMIGEIREKDSSISVIAVASHSDVDDLFHIPSRSPFALIQNPIEAQQLLLTIVRARASRGYA